MKRLFPQSLFWRLIWVLFLGMFLILLLGLLFNQEERGELLTRTAGNQSANRIADTVNLLDSLDTTERNRIISILNVPGHRVRLNNAPVTIDPNTEQVDQNTPSLNLFHTQLAEVLGDNRPVQVTLLKTPTDTDNNYGPGYGMRRMGQQNDEHPMQGRGHGRGRMMWAMYGHVFMVQVQLLDGQWVIFDTGINTANTPNTALPWRLLVTLMIVFCAVLLISFVAVRWLTHPLHRLANAATALGQNINQPPLPETGPTEIRQAAHAFNEMQQRIKNHIQGRTQIFAAMSHDLKTPITRLRLRTELMEDDELRQRFENDLHEMETMVLQALDFMKGLDTSQQKQPVNMMALLESIQEDYHDAGKTVTIEGSIQSPFLGIAPLLKRCLVNLLDNAIFYGESAHIKIEDSDQALTLFIRDKGTGIAENELEKVFDPFYRLEQSRNRQTGGTGLGLSIARNIVQSHGGQIQLRNHPDEGLEVTLILPRTALEKADSANQKSA